MNIQSKAEDLLDDTDWADDEDAKERVILYALRRFRGWRSDVKDKVRRSLLMPLSMENN